MNFISAVSYNTWSLLKSVSCWMMFSFLLAGILRNFLRPEVFQKNLGNTKLSSLMKATLSGALLPICSCGVVPLGVSLYYSGAYMGNVLAFMIATPVINPAAVLISLATLGPRLTIAYVSAGLIIPMLIGLIANRVCGPELHCPYAAEQTDSGASVAQKPALRDRLMGGFRWGFLFLGKEISQYMVPGAIFAAFILTVIPVSFIQRYLADPGMVSVLGVVLLGAVMYVCAVGHIPFIAALIGAGASPGIAVTFLLSGTATNLPEIISMLKLFGRRTTAIYCGGIITLAVLWGWATNLLLTNFIPVFDVSINQGKIDMADKLSVYFPEWAEVLCAVILIGMFLWACLPKLQGFLSKTAAKRREA